MMLIIDSGWMWSGEERRVDVLLLANLDADDWSFELDASFSRKQYM